MRVSWRLLFAWRCIGRIPFSSFISLYIALFHFSRTKWARAKQSDDETAGKTKRPFKLTLFALALFQRHFSANAAFAKGCSDCAKQGEWFYIYNFYNLPATSALSPAGHGEMKICVTKVEVVERNRDTPREFGGLERDEVILRSNFHKRSISADARTADMRDPPTRASGQKCPLASKSQIIGTCVTQWFALISMMCIIHDDLST